MSVLTFALSPALALLPMPQDLDPQGNQPKPIKHRVAAMLAEISPAGLKKINLALVGFARGQNFVIYANGERILP